MKLFEMSYNIKDYFISTIYGFNFFLSNSLKHDKYMERKKGVLPQAPVRVWNKLRKYDW